MLANSTEGREIPYRGENILLRSQRGGHQDAAGNKVVGVLDLLLDLEASWQASVTTAGTAGKRTGGQASTLEGQETIAGRQTAMG